MKSGLKIWQNYWFCKVPPQYLALFRISFGLYLLFYFLRFFSNVEVLFSSAGVTVPFLVPDLSPPPFFAWILYLATLLTLCAFILGFRSRVVNPVLLVLFAHHFFLNLAVLNCSFDRLNLIFLFVLTFCRCDQVWSVHSGWAGHSSLPSPAWPLRVVRFQIGIFVFGCGFWKALNPYWQGGDILYHTLQSTWATPAAYWFLGLGLPGLFFSDLWSAHLGNVAYRLIALA